MIDFPRGHLKVSHTLSGSGGVQHHLVKVLLAAPETRTNRSNKTRANVATTKPSAHETPIRTVLVRMLLSVCSWRSLSEQQKQDSFERGVCREPSTFVSLRRELCCNAEAKVMLM